MGGITARREGWLTPPPVRPVRYTVSAEERLNYLSTHRAVHHLAKSSASDDSITSIRTTQLYVTQSAQSLHVTLTQSLHWHSSLHPRTHLYQTVIWLV